jgi:hypothetical protein
MQAKPEALPAPELTREEFEQEACLLAMEIVTQVLRPKHQAQQLRTTVVLDALLRLYLFHARTLPAEAQRACGKALAGLASELLHASAYQPSAPAGAPIH